MDCHRRELLGWQNGMIERLIRSLKEQCVHRYRFESLAHARRAIGDWIQFYNHKRPHQALAMRTPNKAFNWQLNLSRFRWVNTDLPNNGFSSPTLLFHESKRSAKTP
jgi:transposase InsO family protein